MLARVPLVAALALALSAGSAPAQQRPAVATPAARAQLPADVQGWLTELERIHERLEKIQGAALEDPELNAAQLELGSMIKQAMERVDPGMQKRLERLAAMEQEAAAAQQSGDRARILQLGAEARDIERQFAQVQRRVMREPEVVAEVTAFQQKLEAGMLQVSPQADSLLTRLRELEAKLTAAAAR